MSKLKSIAAALAATDLKLPSGLIADGRAHGLTGDSTHAGGCSVARLKTHPAGACLVLSWGAPGGAKPASKRQLGRELSRRSAQLDAFSQGIVDAGARQDSELSVNYAAKLLRVAQCMLDLEAQPEQEAA